MKRDLTEDQLRQEVTVALPLSVLLSLNDSPAFAIASAPRGRWPVGAEIEGGKFAGVTVHEEAPYELVLLPGEAEKVTFEEAEKWAAAQGGVLPSRIDQLVLLKNVKSEFKGEWYWSGERHAGDAGYAWDQGFGYGGQGYGDVSSRGRARAVRRIPIR
jgi:hypothetical protein